MQTTRFFLLLLCLPSALAAAGMTPEQRLADFDQMVNILRSSYSMIEYKATTQNINFDQVVKSYRPRVEQLTEDTQVYDLFSAFIAEFKDAHLKHLRPSSMSAKLGFSLRRIDSKAIITQIDGDILKSENFPFKVGDEVVSLDRKPIAQLLRERRPFISSGREDSAFGKIIRLMASPSGTMGDVPRGICQVEVRPFGETTTQTISLPWIVKGKPLPGLNFFLSGMQHGRLTPDASEDPVDVADKPVGLPLWAPDDGLKVESSQFPAVLFDTPKGTVGYLRVPTFSPDDTKAALVEFKRVLGQMKLARGLILDLTDNPGGSVTYGLSICGTLTNKVLQVPKKAQRANRQTLADFRRQEQSNDPEERAMAEYHAAEIEKAMTANLDMTPPIALSYRPSQAPDPVVQYTKPLVVMINDQSYSCADLVPSILKDNGRATLFGATTAGAGGSVSQMGPLSYTGSSLTVTINLTQRVNGTYIENNGVAPDVPYEVTQADVHKKYAGYKKAYTAALTALLP
jgi:hypothetical protein